MAKKKFDLDAIDTSRAEQAESTAGSVFKSIETGASRKGQQGTASPQEIDERRSTLQTQGRKGARAIRINMAFTPDNHAFIKYMGKASGMGMTAFLNSVIDTYRQEHGEIYEQAQALLKSINDTYQNAGASETEIKKNELLQYIDNMELQDELRAERVEGEDD